MLEGAGGRSETQDLHGESSEGGAQDTRDEAQSLDEFVGNRVQPAFFHPDWTFEGLPATSPVHFEKRAPLPVINILRREQLDRVVSEGLARGVIVNKMIS